MITKEIEAMKEIIVETYHPDKVILFGSYARDEETPDSDIDLLVVSDNEKDTPRHRRGRGVRRALAKLRKPYDVLFYTQEELGKYNDIRQSFNATVLREGVVLYE